MLRCKSLLPVDKTKLEIQNPSDESLEDSKGNFKVIQGDALRVLKTLPDKSVQCCITSPPYWGLRDYSRCGCVLQRFYSESMRTYGGADRKMGCGGNQSPDDLRCQKSPDPFCPVCHGTGRIAGMEQQIGLEKNPEKYVNKLVEIFREVKRVLRDDGTLFMVIGDTYMGSWGASSYDIDGKAKRMGFNIRPPQSFVSVATQNEPSYDISGKAPEDCPLHDSIWNRPCDGCRAVSVLRTFHKGQFLSDVVDPSQEHTESENGHFPTLDSLNQKRTRQSSAAIQGQMQMQGRVTEPLLSSEVSISPASSSELPQNDSTQNHEEKYHDEFCSATCDVQKSGHKMAYLSLLSRDENEPSNLPSHIDDNGLIGGSFVSHKVGKAYDSCPYLYYTTTPYHSQLKPKDLVGIPWSVAFALRADGWYLRQDIIWSKPNPMPESVTDRCTKSHEYIFLLTKNQKYYYDAEAIKDPYTEPMNRWGGPKLIAKGKSEWDRGTGQMTYRDRDMRPDPYGRNKRSVWTITTKPFKDAHFAVFPEKLVEPCILAGTSPKACGICGAPWERIVKKDNPPHDGMTKSKYPKGTNAKNLAILRQAARKRGEEFVNKSITLGWQPTCEHNDDTGKCLVLDPFSGSGTTGVVAKRYRRKFIGIELNEKYVKMSYKRAKLTIPSLMGKC